MPHQRPTAVCLHSEQSSLFSGEHSWQTAASLCLELTCVHVNSYHDKDTKRYCVCVCNTFHLPPLLVWHGGELWPRAPQTTGAGVEVEWRQIISLVLLSLEKWLRINRITGANQWWITSGKYTQQHVVRWKDIERFRSVFFFFFSGRCSDEMWRKSRVRKKKVDTDAELVANMFPKKIISHIKVFLYRT